MEERVLHEAAKRDEERCQKRLLSWEQLEQERSKQSIDEPVDVDNDFLFFRKIQQQLLSSGLMGRVIQLMKTLQLPQLPLPIPTRLHPSDAGGRPK